MGKLVIYSLFFIVILVLYVCIIIFKHKNTKPTHAEHAEHFIDDPSQSQSQSSTDDYKARLDVMNVFDLNMKRKPTPAEITKYSTFNNEQDILAAVLSDKHNSQQTDAEESQSNQPKHVPITALSSYIEPSHIVLEETTEKYIDSAESGTNEITISREYADELKKQVERLEGELNKFRKILA